jgi:hypothetical protein
MAAPYIPTSAIRPYFRPPYLSLDQASADYLANTYGMYIVQLTVDTKDYEAWSTSQIVSTMENNIEWDSARHRYVCPCSHSAKNLRSLPTSWLQDYLRQFVFLFFPSNCCIQVQQLMLALPCRHFHARSIQHVIKDAHRFSKETNTQSSAFTYLFLKRIRTV